MRYVPGAIPLGGHVGMIVYNRYYCQFDMYLGCHTIPMVTNKNIYGYIV